jgi:hypothetical protein
LIDSTSIGSNRRSPMADRVGDSIGLFRVGLAGGAISPE